MLRGAWRAGEWVSGMDCGRVGVGDGIGAWSGDKDASCIQQSNRLSRRVEAQGPIEASPLTHGPNEGGPLAHGPHEAGPLAQEPNETGPLAFGPNEAGRVAH